MDVYERARVVKDRPKGVSGQTYDVVVVTTNGNAVGFVGDDEYDMVELMGVTVVPQRGGAETFRTKGHIGDCPFPHGSPEGNEWRREFIQAQEIEEITSGNVRRRHLEARQVFAREALTPEQQHTLALMREIDEATGNTPTSTGVDPADDRSFNVMLVFSGPTGDFRRMFMLQAARDLEDAKADFERTRDAARRARDSARALAKQLISMPGAVACPKCGRDGLSRSKAMAYRAQLLRERARVMAPRQCCRDGLLWVVETR